MKNPIDKNDHKTYCFAYLLTHAATKKSFPCAKIGSAPPDFLLLAGHWFRCDGVAMLLRGFLASCAQNLLHKHKIADGALLFLTALLGRCCCWLVWCKPFASQYISSSTLTHTKKQQHYTHLACDCMCFYLG